MFVVIDGGDGVGKTTLINNLKRCREEWVFTKEPNFNDTTQKIRDIIDEGGLCTETVAYLFAAARAENTNKIIKPALTQGKVVISDRYVHSSIIYQGLIGGMGVENVRALNKWAMIEPDMVIVLTGKSKKDTKDNWLDEMGQSDQVVNAFRILAQSDSRFKIINVDNLSPEDVTNKVLAIIEGKDED